MESSSVRSVYSTIDLCWAAGRSKRTLLEIGMLIGGYGVLVGALDVEHPTSVLPALPCNYSFRFCVQM